MLYEHVRPWPAGRPLGTRPLNKEDRGPTVHGVRGLGFTVPGIWSLGFNLDSRMQGIGLGGVNLASPKVRHIAIPRVSGMKGSAGFVDRLCL